MKVDPEKHFVCSEIQAFTIMIFYFVNNLFGKREKFWRICFVPNKSSELRQQLNKKLCSAQPRKYVNFVFLAYIPYSFF